MQDNHLFEYAVIRIVPRVEREEFINAGVILYCKSLNFLKVKIELNEPRLKSFPLETEISELQKNLNAYQQIAEGHPDAGPIAKLNSAERFRWLTATRSTVVQSSKVHPGFCKDAMQALDQLFEQMVRL